MKTDFQRRQWSRAFGLGIFAAAAWAGPVVFEPGEVDFGTKGQGLHLEAEVKMTNTTAKELHVLHVSSDCSCTAGEPRQRRLGPGESTTMPVGMDTRSYQGAVTRRLVVHTSAGDEELRVKATIRAYENWEVIPMSVMLPSSQRQQEASTVVTATYQGGENITVLGATTDQPWLRAEFNAALSGKGGSVVVRKLATAPAGPNLAQLTLRTNDPTQPQLVIKVFVPVVSAARVAPNPIILPTTKAGTAAMRDVVVSGWEEGTAPLAKLPLGRVEAKGRQLNGDYVFTVSVTPATAGMSTQMLQLAVDGNSVLLEVPVILKAEP
jgi:hypothetical protein